MSAEAWIHIGIAVVGYIAIVATLRANQKNMDRRLTRLEERHERLAHDFVPRPEVKAQLDGIERTLADVKGLLQVAIYGGKTPVNRSHEV